MATDVFAVVNAAVDGLGCELVDVERAPQGLLRIFIDKPNGVSIDDCVNVSNHLTRLFVVEGVDFDRLEVSSPGLDRPLKKLEDFQRFMGHQVKVRLNTEIDTRKRFTGVIEAVVGDTVCFRLVEPATPQKPHKRSVLKAGAAVVMTDKTIKAPLREIEKARLVPDV